MVENWEHLREQGLENLWVQFWPYMSLIAPGGFKAMVKGEGCYVTDQEGKRYLDLFGGLMLVNVGYGREEIAEVAREQMAQIHYVPAGTFDHTNIPAIKLAAKVAEKTPGDLSRVFFGSSGGEANETAVKMAWQYHCITGHPQKRKVICRHHSYHGMTYLTSSITGMDYARPSLLEPYWGGAIRVTHPWCYHCEFGLDYPSCDLQCAKEVERAILLQGPESVAAFIGDPASQPSGVSVPPPEYWPMVRSICTKYNVLLILDEVVTAWGRTGKWFGCNHWDIEPDIMAMAKGLSSGYAPISATVAKKEIADVFHDPQDPTKTFAHLYTWGGHPVSCAVALKNLEIMERENLPQRAAETGDYLGKKLEGLRDHPIVGDTRGIGLFRSVELVKDRKTHESFPEEMGIDHMIDQKLESSGVLVRAFNGIISMAPPLVISKDEIDEAVTKLDEAIGEVEKELKLV